MDQQRSAAAVACVWEGGAHVLLDMHAKVADLVQRNALIFGRPVAGGCLVLPTRVRAAVVSVTDNPCELCVCVREPHAGSGDSGLRTAGYVRKAPMSTRPAEMVRMGSI